MASMLPSLVPAVAASLTVIIKKIGSARRLQLVATARLASLAAICCPGYDEVASDQRQ